MQDHPPCDNNTDLLLPICQNSCLAYSKIVEAGNCTSLFDYVHTLTVSSGGSDNLSVVLDLLLNTDCSNSSTYYFYGETFVDYSSCTDLFSEEEKGKPLL